MILVSVRNDFSRHSGRRQLKILHANRIPGVQDDCKNFDVSECVTADYDRCSSENFAAEIN